MKNRGRGPVDSKSSGVAVRASSGLERVAVVTGASTGIGRAIATRLVEDGFKVYGTSRTPKPDDTFPFSLRELDITSENRARDCIAEIVRETGRLDVLVNNAGYLVSGAVEEISLQDARTLFETNFFGAARMIQATIPIMRRQAAGSIVNITSLAGVVPFPFWGFYSSSKAALEALTDALREEVRPFGIQVSAVEPGAINTPFYDVAHRATPLREYAMRRSRFEKAMRGFAEKAPGPKLVAETVSRVVRSSSPALRNPVTKEASWFPLLRTVLPRALFEGGLRASFRLDDQKF